MTLLYGVAPCIEGLMGRLPSDMSARANPEVGAQPIGDRVGLLIESGRERELWETPFEGFEEIQSHLPPVPRPSNL